MTTSLYKVMKTSLLKVIFYRVLLYSGEKNARHEYAQIVNLQKKFIKECCAFLATDFLSPDLPDGLASLNQTRAIFRY